MNEINLPGELNEEHNSILDRFIEMQRNYNSDIEAFIPEDKNFTKRVIAFLINVLDYVIANYEEIDVKEYQQFLGLYHFRFLYGPNGDDMNYFDSDDNALNNEQFGDFCWNIRYEDSAAPKEEFMEIKSKFTQLLAKHNSPVASQSSSTFK
jgi:hypothetical protein